MKLYLVRHGQSVPNAEKRHSGWTQLPLTEQGFADARRAGERLHGISFDRIYSSDLCRAVQTAQAAIPGCEPLQLELLRERSVGCLTEMLVDDCFTQYGDLYRDARARLDFTQFGGENVEILTNRAAQFLRMLEEDPCEIAIAFSHAGFIEAAIELVLGVRLDRTRMRIPNASIHLFVREDDHWRLAFGEI